MPQTKTICQYLLANLQVTLASVIWLTLANVVSLLGLVSGTTLANLDVYEVAKPNADGYINGHDCQC